MNWLTPSATLQAPDLIISGFTAVPPADHRGAPHARGVQAAESVQPIDTYFRFLYPYTLFVD
jgi:hypothetical protein